MTADHLLHLASIEEQGYVRFDLTCEHPTTKWPDEWTAARHGGSDGECWLMSWWEDLGNELLGDDPPWPTDPTFPLPVKTVGYGEDVEVVYDPPPPSP